MSAARAERGPCPATEDLERLAAGERVDELRGHVDGCRDCADRVETMRRDNELLSDLREADAEGSMPSDAGAESVVVAGYEIGDELHRGSQGVVYRAVQTATKRAVAIKVMLPGAFGTERQRRRFEREVELVASLRHPNIVTVYDSGIAADGRHFLAMEYVDGRPLGARGADGDTPGAPPPIEATLERFAKLCLAVGAAHQRGIIHRDLKPANILVDDDGEPHVLDFGVAKALGVEAIGERRGETIAGEFVGTLAYAAPEQVGGDPTAIDTRADVYALGVILYEMITGRRPYTLVGSIREIVETITATTPPPPSSHRPDVDEDVDTIVLTALAKTPEDRYQSVPELLADLHRYRTGAPIDARRHDTRYVLLKTMRRYRAPLTAAAAAVLLLTAFAITMWAMYREAVAARYEMAKSLGTSLGIIGSIDLENPDSPLPAADIPTLLEEAVRSARDLHDVPEVAAPVHKKLGLAFLSLSQFEPAEDQLRTALGMNRRVAPESAAVADSLHDLGRLYWKQGSFDRARLMYEEALAMRRTVLGQRHEAVARTMQHLASTLSRLGHLDDAERLHREALVMRASLLGPDHRDVAISCNALASCLHDQARYAEALVYFRRALDIVARTGLADGWQGARAMHGVAFALIDLGELDEAGALLERSLTIMRRTRDDDDPDIARAYHELGRLHLARGDLDTAEAYARHALQIRRDAFAEGHPEWAAAHELVGRVLAERRQHDLAIRFLQRAVNSSRSTFGHEHWRTAVTEGHLGVALAGSGNAEAAERRLHHAVRQLEQTLGPDAAPTKAAARALELVMRDGGIGTPDPEPPD